MLITIGERTRQNMSRLKLDEYPFTIEDLKSNYKMLLKKHHEDNPKNIDKEKAKINTQKLIESFKELEGLAISYKSANGHVVKNSEFIKQQRKTRDMFDLTKTCTHCAGKGTVSHHIREPCHSCDPRPSFMMFMDAFSDRTKSGYKNLECRPCKGTGKFTLRSGREVECRKCKGSGVFRVRCKFCRGNGYIYRESEVICPKCDGEGVIELEMFNPVIPKGAVL